MKRRCSSCGKGAEESEFWVKSKGRRSGMCRACKQAYNKKWYRKNRDRHIRAARLCNLRSIRRNREEILKYLKIHPCVDCGERDPVILDFDHVRGKKRASIASMLHKIYSWKTIWNEIGKCEVRCANCHRRKTAKEFGWYRLANVGAIPTGDTKI